MADAQYKLEALELKSASPPKLKECTVFVRKRLFIISGEVFTGVQEFRRFLLYLRFGINGIESSRKRFPSKMNSDDLIPLQTRQLLAAQSEL